VGVNEPGLLVVAAGTAGVEGVGAGVFVGGNAVGCIRGGGEGEGAVFDSLVMMMVRKNSQDLEKGRGGFLWAERGRRERKLTDSRIDLPPHRNMYALSPSHGRIRLDHRSLGRCLVGGRSCR
jgi:hypothetical protein